MILFDGAKGRGKPAKSRGGSKPLRGRQPHGHRTGRPEGDLGVPRTSYPPRTKEIATASLDVKGISAPALTLG